MNIELDLYTLIVLGQYLKILSNKTNKTTFKVFLQILQVFQTVTSGGSQVISKGSQIGHQIVNKWTPSGKDDKER